LQSRHDPPSLLKSITNKSLPENDVAARASSGPTFALVESGRRYGVAHAHLQGNCEASRLVR
jgi:hypothetical protein